MLDDDPNNPYNDDYEEEMLDDLTGTTRVERLEEFERRIYEEPDFAALFEPPPCVTNKTP
jgi:hypothetical protein